MIILASYLRQCIRQTCIRTSRIELFQRHSLPSLCVLWDPCSLSSPKLGERSCFTFARNLAERKMPCWNKTIELRLVFSTTFYLFLAKLPSCLNEVACVGRCKKRFSCIFHDPCRTFSCKFFSSIYSGLILIQLLVQLKLIFFNWCQQNPNQSN